MHICEVEEFESSPDRVFVGSEQTPLQIVIDYGNQRNTFHIMLGEIPDLEQRDAQDTKVIVADQRILGCCVLRNQEGSGLSSLTFVQRQD